MLAVAVFMSAHSGFGCASIGYSGFKRKSTAFSLPIACKRPISSGDPPKPARLNKCLASSFVHFPFAGVNMTDSLLARKHHETNTVAYFGKFP